MQIFTLMIKKRSDERRFLLAGLHLKIINRFLKFRKRFGHQQRGSD